MHAGEQERKVEPMSKNELNRFRAVLTAKVAELERFACHRDGIAIERSADQLEEVQAASDRALAVCSLDREFNQLRNARAALGRIRDGSFGTCQQCDQEINAKRLAALPWATYCVRCQEAVDNNLDGLETPSREVLVRAA